MSPETEKKLANVKKYSRSLKLLFNFFAVLAAIAGVIALITLTASARSGVNSTIFFGGGSYTGEEITTTLRIVIALGIVLSISLTVKLLYHLGKLFGLYADGEIFTVENVRQIRQIGISVFLFIVVWPFTMIANAIIGTSPLLPETTTRVEHWSFGIPDPFTVVIAGTIIVVVSWIMDVGRELREDQDLTV